MRSHLDQKSRRRADAASKAMKRRAKQRTCPDCKRGNALSRHEDDGGLVVYVCRYCKHEHGYYVPLALPSVGAREAVPK